MPRLVYVTETIHEEALTLLDAAADLVVGFGPEARELESVVPEAHAILVRTVPIPAEAIDRARSLRVVARHGVGVDSIAVDAATRRGIPVLITPRANLRSVAEQVFALALAVGRNTVRSDRLVRDGSFTDRDKMVGRELFGARLGVVGFGRIGKEVARIATGGFGMDVLAYDPYLPDDEILAGGAQPVGSLTDLLGACELLTVHVPLNSETYGLLGPRELACMPPGSVLIQASRGGVVDENALVDALREGHLAGAGIDVFEQEPPPEDHPFFSLEQVVLTPHTAAHTRQAMRRMAVDAASGIIDVLDGADVTRKSDSAAWEAVNPGCASAAKKDEKRS